MNGLPDMEKNISFLQEIKNILPCCFDGKEIKTQELCREFDCPLVELFRNNIGTIGLRQSVELKVCDLLEKLRKDWEVKKMRVRV
ncbi:hypothetical protein KJ763_01625 [Patescibacteria group bacterium]|nr:hypothetical protein [Patescibacteria group bacterium]